MIWSYIYGMILVSPLGRTQAEKTYIGHRKLILFSQASSILI